MTAADHANTVREALPIPYLRIKSPLGDHVSWLRPRAAKVDAAHDSLDALQAQAETAETAIAAIEAADELRERAEAAEARYRDLRDLDQTEWEKQRDRAKAAEAERNAAVRERDEWEEKAQFAGMPAWTRLWIEKEEAVRERDQARDALRDIDRLDGRYADLNTARHIARAALDATAGKETT